MMHKTAHKDLVNPPGQIKEDVTLGDYITRKTRQDAFDQVKAEQLIWCKEMFEGSVNNAWPNRLQVIIDKNGDGRIQGWGCELVLCKNGTWYMSDTSGG